MDNVIDTQTEVWDIFTLSPDQNKGVRANVRSSGIAMKLHPEHRELVGLTSEQVDANATLSNLVDTFESKSVTVTVISDQVYDRITGGDNDPYGYPVEYDGAQFLMKLSKKPTAGEQVTINTYLQPVANVWRLYCMD